MLSVNDLIKVYKKIYINEAKEDTISTQQKEILFVKPLELFY